MNFTMRKSTAASMRKLIKSVRNHPYSICASLILKYNSLKSDLPKIAATNCMMT
jgi:hypothetical protein